MGDNPWTYIGIMILAVTAFIILVSLLIGFLVSAAAKGFANKTVDTFAQDMTKKLPGKNCGDCGYESCEAYAEAVLLCEAPEIACPHGAPGLPETLNAYVDRFQKMAEDPTPIKKKTRFWDRYIK